MNKKKNDKAKKSGGKAQDQIKKIGKKQKGLVDEFKEFALRGNVIDLAVGVIIGGAFQKIVSSVVNDLIMPIVGAITGNVSFNEMFVVLRAPVSVDKSTIKTLADAQAAGVTTLNYGAFITTVIDFFIMAIIIFAMVKLINKFANLNKEEKEEVAPDEKECPFCLSKIPVKATRCKYCTSELDIVESTSTTTT